MSERVNFNLGIFTGVITTNLRCADAIGKALELIDLTLSTAGEDMELRAAANTLQDILTYNDEPFTAIDRLNGFTGRDITTVCTTWNHDACVDPDCTCSCHGGAK